VLFLVRVAVLLLVPRSEAAFGWYAYAPLTDTALTWAFVFLDPTHWSAVVVGIVGLVVVAFADASRNPSPSTRQSESRSPHEMPGPTRRPGQVQ
jgi:heme/copper-type cytochrome/quinol oxidase subunit 1